jgi:hypothetical protein
MRDEELIATLDEESPFPVGEDLVAVYPSRRFDPSLLVVWVG